MNENNGILEKIEQKTNDSGTEYLIAKIDGQLYGVWDKELIPAMKIMSVNVPVKFSFETKGKYKNIKTISVLEGQSFPSSSQEATKQNEMRRLNAANNASHILTCLKDLGLLGNLSEPAQVLKVWQNCATHIKEFLETGDIKALANVVLPSGGAQ